MLQGLQLLRAEAGPLQADLIEAVGMGLALSGSQRERQNILGDGGAAADVGVLARYGRTGARGRARRRWHGPPQ